MAVDVANGDMNFRSGSAMNFRFRPLPLPISKGYEEPEKGEL